MTVKGSELLRDARGLKFILNDTGILFFPTSLQHREVKAPGLSYEDDYAGNAVAGIITPDHVELRYHKAFSDERIRDLWTKVSKVPAVAQAKLGRAYYQGREVS
jgi:hypothetical protein